MLRNPHKSLGDYLGPCITILWFRGSGLSAEEELQNRKPQNHVCFASNYKGLTSPVPQRSYDSDGRELCFARILGLEVTTTGESLSFQAHRGKR